jgi:hypothetical protein
VTVRLAAPVGTLLCLVACGNDGAPGSIPDIQGLYTGTWNLAVENDRVACPAALTITDQTDSVFRTSIELLRRNGSGLSCIDTIETGDGVVHANRTVSALAELVEPTTCTLREPNTGLTGNVAGDSIDLVGRYTYECADDFRWTLRFAGSTAGAPLPAYPDVRGTYAGAWTTLATGLQITCPVTVQLSSQTRDDVTGTYRLEEEGICSAQPSEPVSGVVTVDGELSVSGPPPVPVGCVVEQELSLWGDATGGTLELVGIYALVCGNSVRELAVTLSATR